MTEKNTYAQPLNNSQFYCTRTTSWGCCNAYPQEGTLHPIVILVGSRLGSHLSWSFGLYLYHIKTHTVPHQDTHIVTGSSHGPSWPVGSYLINWSTTVATSVDLKLADPESQAYPSPLKALFNQAQPKGFHPGTVL